MFSGKNPLLKEVLYSFLDYGLRALVEEDEKCVSKKSGMNLLLLMQKG